MIFQKFYQNPALPSRKVYTQGSPEGISIQLAVFMFRIFALFVFFCVSFVFSFVSHFSRVHVASPPPRVMGRALCQTLPHPPPTRWTLPGAPQRACAATQPRGCSPGRRTATRGSGSGPALSASATSSSGRTRSHAATPLTLSKHLITNLAHQLLTGPRVACEGFSALNAHFGILIIESSSICCKRVLLIFVGGLPTIPLGKLSQGNWFLPSVFAIPSPWTLLLIVTAGRSSSNFFPF